MSAVGVARRRSLSLRRGTDDRDAFAVAGERLVRHVLGLALPGLDDAARVRALARPAALAGAAVVLAIGVVGGAVGLCVVALAAATADVVARRTAPARRDAEFERALPLVLESVARRLRAGGSLAMALDDASPERPAALAHSWRSLVRRARAIGVEPALGEWSSASDLPSVQLAGAALGLAASTGGSPARAIDGVAATLRARQALAEEIRALSSQSKASAVVIAASPLVFGAAAATTDDRTGAFLRTPLGLLLLVAGVALDLAGWWWMAKLCRPPGSHRRRRR